MTSRKRRILHVVVTIFLIALGVGGMVRLTASKKEIQQRKPPAPLPVVRVVQVSTGPHWVTIQGEGTVNPLQEIDLVPQVEGKVLYVSPVLVDGGAFQEGETLLRIDPVDYQLAVTLAQSKIKDSESRLKLAQEEASAAKEEWRILYKGSGEGDQEPPPLVAKKPQLEAAKARLEADKADLRKALLNLERTELKAPFEGRVSGEHVDVGQYVRPGQVLAQLYSTEAAEIVIPLEDRSLYWLDVPGFTSADEEGSTAHIHTAFGGREQNWQGRVVRAEGKLDERTRMVRVVVRVDDPYRRKPPLAPGLFLKVAIRGRKLEQATRIPRSALGEQSSVWVVVDGRMQLRQVDVAWVQNDDVLIASGLRDGEMVAISSPKAVTRGMVVRTIEIGKGNP